MSRAAPDAIQNVDAEAALLGAAFADDDAAEDVVEALRLADLTRTDHRLVFEAVRRIYMSGRRVTTFTVCDDLGQTGGLSKVGGREFVEHLPRLNPAGVVDDYAAIVRERARRRTLASAFEEGLKAIRSGRDIDHVADRAEQAIMAIADGDRAGNTPVSSRNLTMDSVFAALQPTDGIATGWPSLDAKIGSLERGKLHIVAGRPSMGKSAFAGCLAANVALAGTPVCVFTFEMRASQMLNVRTVAQLSEVPLSSIARDRTVRDYPRDRLSESERQAIADAVERLQQADLTIDDGPHTSILKLRAAARRWVKRYGPGLLIVDYLQLMSSESQVESRQQEVSAISRGLVSLARELDVPIVALSQLSREPEKRADRRPIMSDLRESGSLEQDAETVILLHRPEYYGFNRDDQGRSLADRAEIIVGKARDAETGSVWLGFRASQTRFFELTTRE